jgi:hypothetical protein
MVQVEAPVWAAGDRALAPIHVAVTEIALEAITAMGEESPAELLLAFLVVLGNSELVARELHSHCPS